MEGDLRVMRPHQPRPRGTRGAPYTVAAVAMLLLAQPTIGLAPVLKDQSNADLLLLLPTAASGQNRGPIPLETLKAGGAHSRQTSATGDNPSAAADSAAAKSRV